MLKIAEHNSLTYSISGSAKIMTSLTQLSAQRHAATNQVQKTVYDPRLENRPYYDLPTEELVKRIDQSAYKSIRKELIAELYARSAQN
jgi:hypothetical protein